MATQRIYCVTVAGSKPRLVRTTHPNLAVQHVSRALIKVAVATQDELVDCVSKGITVEEPGQDQPELPMGG